LVSEIPAGDGKTANLFFTVFVNPLLRYEFAPDPFYKYNLNPIFYCVYVPHTAGRGPLRRGPGRRGSERSRVGRGAGNRAAGIP
jgi:hypothetical protein